MKNVYAILSWFATVLNGHSQGASQRIQVQRILNC